MRTLTLCMIVRDEEAVLPSFLRAVSGLWDELCVVDTGSVDRTTDTIRHAGGRVQKVLWNDDFSEARNTCLEMASSDWVIFLDADEVVSPSCIQSARAQLARQDRGACVMGFVSMQPDGSIHRVHHLRMFRRHSSVRYRFRVHENVSMAVESYLTRTKLGVGCLAGHIDHQGGRAERQIVKNVRQRDAHLIDLMLREDPYDLHAWNSRIEHTLRWRPPSIAQKIIAPALQALKDAPWAQREDAGGMAEALVVSAARCLAIDNAAVGLAVLNEWQDKIVLHSHFYVARGELLVRCERPAAASADFERALSLAHTSFDVHNACIRPLLHLARLYQQQNDCQHAQTLVDQALGFDARHPKSLEALASVYRQAHGLEGVRAAAESYIAKFGDCPELQAAFVAHNASTSRV